MLSNSPQNPLELKDVILSRLGAPIVNIEVSRDQVMECISRAIELFTEYHPDGTNRGYIMIPVDQTILDSQIVQFDFPVYAIESMLRVGRDYFSMGGGTTMAWFSDFVNGMAAGYGGRNQSMLTGGAMFGAGGGLQVYNQTMSYLNLLYDQLQPVYDFWFNETSNSAQVNGEYILGELLVFKVWTPTSTSVSNSELAIGSAHAPIAGGNNINITADQTWQNPASQWVAAEAGVPYAKQGVYDNRWVKDMATALTKQLNGIVLKKNQGMVLPGGVTIDGQTMYQEATEEIAMLREELKELDQPLGIIYG